MVDNIVYSIGTKETPLGNMVIRRTSWCALVGLVAVLVFSELFPTPTAGLLLAGLRASAGLEANTVETSFGPIHYLEGGEGEPVVFLHGVFARKEHWIEMSRQLSDDFHVVLLDLPGFGDNHLLEPDAYDYRSQAQNTLTVLDALELERVHIVANSMGAQIAGLIAADQPHRVMSLAFVGGAAGVPAPVPSDMTRASDAGEMPLVVASTADYNARMEWLFTKQPFLPRPISRAWAKAEAQLGPANRGIWNAVWASQVPPLLDLAGHLRQRTLVLWCGEDRVFHVSGAELLGEALAGADLVTWDGCGHLPMLERPRETGRLVRRFLLGG